VGDAFIEPKSEIKKAVDLHNSCKPFATVLAREVDNPTKYGILKINDSGSLIETIEKPSWEEAEKFKTKSGKYLVNLGIYILTPKFFDYFEKTPLGKKNEYQVPNVLNIALKNGEKIKIITIKGKYLDLGNWEDAEKAWKD
jgi:dTDP-glucose pyrophosphorylase